MPDNNPQQQQPDPMLAAFQARAQKNAAAQNLVGRHNRAILLITSRTVTPTFSSTPTIFPKHNGGTPV